MILRTLVPLGFFLLIPAFASAAVYPPDGKYNPVAGPDIPRPGYLVPITDPIWGTKITRITDSAAFGQSNVRHSYSKIQAWNADQTLISVSNWILDGSTYKILRKIPNIGDRVWSSIDHNKIYGTSGNKFVTMNASTGAITTLHVFSGYGRIQIGPGEGNMSIDDRYAAFLADGRDVIVYDISTDTVIATKSLSSLEHGSSIDWVSMSQSGNYVVINGKGANRFTASYDRNLNKIATLLSRHADLGYDTSGNEVLVTVCNTGTQMFRLSDGQKTSNLLPATAGSQCGHVSTRNYKRPGWAYVTSQSAPQYVMAVKLDDSQTVEHFTHHRSNAATYYAQPHAVSSPDGTKVMFASDWGGDEINSYVVEWPQCASPPCPIPPPPPPPGP